MLKYFLPLILLLTVLNAQSQKITPEQYINQYKDVAIKEMKQYGIPASITLAQGCLESNFGNSMLAVKANNHFGIKCHSDWNGKKIFQDDDKKNECFRHYKSAWESFRDHSEFLKKQSRYAFLFEYDILDYKKWAYGLKKAGYATSSTYPQRIITIIEKYYLAQYDKGVSTNNVMADNNSKPIKNKYHKSKQRKNYQDDFSFNPFGRDIKMNNGIKYITAKANDTYYKIAEEMEMMKWQIYKYNELPKDAEIHEGQIIYLQPKHRKAEHGQNKYIVKEGDTLYRISQQFGMKSKKLRRKNNLTPQDTVKAGDVLWLRKRKPAHI